MWNVRYKFEELVKMFTELLVGHLHPFVLHWMPLACFDSPISVERGPYGDSVQIPVPGVPGRNFRRIGRRTVRLSINFSETVSLFAERHRGSNCMNRSRFERS
jgi:hypothetical protein